MRGRLRGDWETGIYGSHRRTGKREFVEVSARPEQHCHSEPVRFPGVGISIEFRAAYRHPFVGAVIDRPPGRARTQVVTNLVYNRFCPFNFGMIATGFSSGF